MPIALFVIIAVVLLAVHHGFDYIKRCLVIDYTMIESEKMQKKLLFGLEEDDNEIGNDTLSMLA